MRNEWLTLYSPVCEISHSEFSGKLKVSSPLFHIFPTSRVVNIFCTVDKYAL